MEIKEIVKKSLAELEKNKSNDPKTFKGIIRDKLPDSSDYNTKKLINHAHKLDDNWLKELLNSNDTDKVNTIIVELKRIVEEELEPNNKIQEQDNNLQTQTITNPPKTYQNNNKIIIDIKYLIASVAIIILIIGIIFIFKNSNISVNNTENTTIEI